MRLFDPFLVKTLDSGHTQSVYSCVLPKTVVNYTFSADTIGHVDQKWHSVTNCCYYCIYCVFFFFGL